MSYKKALTVFILAAFINSLISGCTATVTRNIENLAENQHRRQSDDSILGLILDDRTVTFDSLGGFFDKKTGTIAGVTDDGRPLRLGSDAIRKVQAVFGGSPDDPPETVPFTRAITRLGDSRLEPVLKLKIASSETPVEFAPPGGWIHPGHRLVSGTGLDRTLLSYAFDQIEYAFVKEYHSRRSALTITIIVIFALGALIAIGAALSSSMSPGA